MPGTAGLLTMFALVALPAPGGPACMRATHTLAAGAVATAEDFLPVACGDTKPASGLRYDAAQHAARLVRSLQPGDVVAAVPAALLATVRPGDTLYVQVHVGPVVVQREVQALQAAKPGQKLFVRAANGTVMSARYGGGAG